MTRIGTTYPWVPGDFDYPDEHHGLFVERRGDYVVLIDPEVDYDIYHGTTLVGWVGWYPFVDSWGTEHCFHCWVDGEPVTFATREEAFDFAIARHEA